MESPFKLPHSIYYNRRRPKAIFGFGFIFLIWKLFSPLMTDFANTSFEVLRGQFMDPFTWIIPLIAFFTAWKMWNRVILRFDDQDLYVYALFGPGERRYRYLNFSRLVIMQGKLYVLKEDPETEADRGVFIIAGWALNPTDWVLLADHLKALHHQQASDDEQP